MRIEIISVGRELIAGTVSDTGSSYMAERFSAAGVTVSRITCVDENIGEISAVMRESMERETQVLVVAGGFGLERGGVTLSAVSNVAGVRLLADTAALRLVKKRWEALCNKGVLPFKHSSPELLKLATIPSGAELLENNTGIVPGIKMRVGGMTIYCLPGEPDEMKPMFEEAVYPQVVLLSGGGAVIVRRVRIKSGDEKAIRRWIRLVEDRFSPISIMTRRSHGGGEEDMTVEFITAEGSREDSSRIERALRYFQELQEEGGKGEKKWIAE